MSNQERIKARIARDKARRAAKRAPAIAAHGRLEVVITNQNLHRSLRKRRKGVEWKGTVQNYLAHAIVKIKRAKDDILAGKINLDRQIGQMTIYERGKKRHVHMVRIDSRVIQGALCDACITPLALPGIIYDNPASMQGRGVSYARDRLNTHLRRQINRSGPDFYVLTFDFKSFFDSIPHKLCLETLKKLGLDQQLCDLIMYFIKMYHRRDIEALPDPLEREMRMRELDENRSRGCTLGSQISQNMAVSTPNPLDHYIKDIQRVRGYERYMDDGMLTGALRETLTEKLDGICAMCCKLGFALHAAKTRIVKATAQPFTFLKVRYRITKTGGIIRRMAKDSIVRMRRKLKKFRKLVDGGIMTRADVIASLKSWLGNAERVAQSYHVRKAMLQKYYLLFGYPGRRKGVIA